MKTNERNHSRAPGQTSISASVTQSTKTRLAALAKADNRTLSNFLSIQFERILDSLEKSGQSNLAAADTAEQIGDAIKSTGKNIKANGKKHQRTISTT